MNELEKALGLVRGLCGFEGFCLLQETKNIFCLFLSFIEDDFNLLADSATLEREFSVLEMIQDNYPKYVLSMDRVNRSRNGIKHINMIEFLLSGI